MSIKFRKNALKFLESCEGETLANIRLRLNQLATYVEAHSLIPFNELDIKKMKGSWKGFYRLRLGKIRVIFALNLNLGDIEIYTIGLRKDVYRDR